MTALGINVTSKEPVTGWEAIQPTVKNHRYEPQEVISLRERLVELHTTLDHRLDLAEQAGVEPGDSWYDLLADIERLERELADTLELYAAHPELFDDDREQSWSLGA